MKKLITILIVAFQMSAISQSPSDGFEKISKEANSSNGFVRVCENGDTLTIVSNGGGIVLITINTIGKIFKYSCLLSNNDIYDCLDSYNCKKFMYLFSIVVPMNKFCYELNYIILTNNTICFFLKGLSTISNQTKKLYFKL